MQQHTHIQEYATLIQSYYSSTKTVLHTVTLFTPAVIYICLLLQGDKQLQLKDLMLNLQQGHNELQSVTHTVFTEFDQLSKIQDLE